MVPLPAGGGGLARESLSAALEDELAFGVEAEVFARLAGVIAAAAEHPTEHGAGIVGHAIPKPKRHAVTCAELGDTRLHSLANEMGGSVDLAAREFF